MADPIPYLAGGSGKHAGQRQHLGIVEKPNFGRQSPSDEVVGHGLVRVKICLEFLFGQRTFRSLQEIMDSFGDLEKLWITLDDDPFGGQAQGIHQWDHGLKDLSHTASGGGAVYVDEFQIPEVIRDGSKLIS